MSCQAFGNLLQQHGNIITDVCCLELEVKNIRGCYFANVLDIICLNNQNNKNCSLLPNPAVYLFLVDIQTFTNFFSNYSSQCSLSSYTNYFPLYVGSTTNFCLRYGSFVASLLSGMRYPHVFGGELHEHLRSLPNFQPNFQPIEMCLVVFYTNEVKKSNGKGYEKDKAKCIEHFILNHTNFCKTFNKNNSNCSLQGNQQRQQLQNIANSIIQTIQTLQSCP